MTLASEVVDKTFYIDGEDRPPIHVKQIRIYDTTATDDSNEWYLDPDEADRLIDDLIESVSDVGYYDTKEFQEKVLAQLAEQGVVLGEED